MKAVITHGYGDARVEEAPRPEPGPDEALLTVRRVQLSVTECKLYHGEEIAHYETVRDRLADGPARLFGHEFSADVIETGANVDHVSTGDRVYAPAKVHCGACTYCRSGYERYCPDKTYVGYDVPGALAEYAAIPGDALRTVPDALSDAEVAALQPLASSILCVSEAGIETGDHVAVVGTGVMGYQCAQLSLLEGAERVHVVDVDAEKLSIAADRGLEPIDARERDPSGAVRDRTDGVGADVVFAAVGGEQSHMTEGSDPVAQAVRTARSGGTVVQVGYVIGDLTLSARAMRTRSITWRNPVTGIATTGPGRDTGGLAAKLVASDRVSIAEYVTHQVDGLSSVEGAIEMTENKGRYGARGPTQILVGDG